MKRISIFSFLIGTLLAAGPALADDPWHPAMSQADLNQKAYQACIGSMLLGNGSNACTQSIQTCVNTYRQNLYAACSSYEDYYGDDYYNCKESQLDAAAEVAKTHQMNIHSACSLIPQTWPTACGNGVKEQGEACDDGNQVDNDGCSNACAVNLTFIPIIMSVVSEIPPVDDKPSDSGKPTAVQPQSEPVQPVGEAEDSSGIPGSSNASGGGCTLSPAAGSVGSAWLGLLALIVPGAFHWLRRK